MNDLSPVTAMVTTALGLLCGPLVPWLIGRVPEPETDEEPKELYADIAAAPWLGVKAAAAGGVSAGLLGLALGWSWTLLVMLPLVPSSIALAVIDWRTRLLPRYLVWPTLAVTAATVLAAWILDGFPGGGETLVRAALGMAVAFAAYFLLWLIYPRGMGFGDVRLSGVLGLALGYLGWSEWGVGLYGGFLLGAVIGGVLSLLKVVDRKGYPFGPFMLVGALLGVLVGQPLIDAIYS